MYTVNLAFVILVTFCHFFLPVPPPSPVEGTEKDITTQHDFPVVRCKYGTKLVFFWTEDAFRSH